MFIKFETSDDGHLEVGGDPLSNSRKRIEDDKVFSNPELIKLEVCDKPFRIPDPSKRDLVFLIINISVIVLIYLLSRYSLN